MTTALTKDQREIIMQNPKVISFNNTVAKLEEAGRLATIQIACEVYKADNNGTTAAMGLESAAQFLQQVRGYSKAQAMNYQRVGKFLQGIPLKDANGNTYPLTNIVKALETAKDESKARELLTNGTLSALMSVNGTKKAIDKAINPQIAATAESRDITDTESTESTESKPNVPDDVYSYDITCTVPDANGPVTVHSAHGRCKIEVLAKAIEKARKATGRGDFTVTVKLTAYKPE